MKLHSGNFAWQHNLHHPPKYKTLQQNLSCDCLVVGGGVSGALCAYLLAESGVNTVLIDKRAIASGSTLANTGLIQYANDKTLTSLIYTFGEEQAVRFYQLCREAVDKLIKLGESLNKDARFHPRNSLYFASTEEDAGLLHKEYETLRKYNFPAEWWDKTLIAERFPFERPGAIYNAGDAEGNPYAFVHGLIEAAACMGLTVFENTELTGFEFQQDGVLCRTGKQHIRARHVIIATGYETRKFHKERGAYLTSSYVYGHRACRAF